jgi:hypothetical protein
MANDANVNPIYVDSTGVITTKQVKIDSILWVSDETAGDDIAATDFFELADANGNILVSKRAEDAGDGLNRVFWGSFYTNGITCNSIDGGIAFIYIV